MRTALVTGANGFIGAHVVRELVDGGYRVRGLVRASSDLRSMVGVDVEVVRGDVRQVAGLVAAAAGCDLLIHTAAVYAYGREAAPDVEQVAVNGTRNVIEAAAESAVDRLVLTSSSVVCGSSTRAVVRTEEDQLRDPAPPRYYLAKAAQEIQARRMAEAHGLSLAVVCPTVTVGPHDYRLVPSNAIVVRYLTDPFKTTFPGGGNVVHVEDVARAHRLAAEQGGDGARYLAAGENLEWSLLHRTISELTGLPGPLLRANHTAAYLGAAGLEMLARLNRQPPLITREEATTVGRYYWYSHAKLAKLGYEPRPARRALAQALPWLVRSTHVSRSWQRRITLASECHELRGPTVIHAGRA